MSVLAICPLCGLAIEADEPYRWTRARYLVRPDLGRYERAVMPSRLRHAVCPEPPRASTVIIDERRMGRTERPASLPDRTTVGDESFLRPQGSGASVLMDTSGK